MSRLITAILLILAVSLNAAVPVTSPEEVIASAAKSFKNAKSVTAPYSMTMDGNTVKGEAVISGDKFRITTPGMSIWYDGRTQWTYSSSTRRSKRNRADSRGAAANQPVCNNQLIPQQL